MSSTDNATWTGTFFQSSVQERAEPPWCVCYLALAVLVAALDDHLDGRARSADVLASAHVHAKVVLGVPVDELETELEEET